MRTITKTDLSKLAGVSQAAVSKAVMEGRVIALSDGTIDADSSECQSYIRAKEEQKQRKAAGKAKHKKRATQKTRPRQRNHPKRSVDPVEAIEKSETEDEINAAMDKLFLEKRKLAAQAYKFELDNAKSEGRLVSREVMVRGVWAPLETFLVRILSDGAKKIGKSLHQLGGAGGTREEFETAVRSEMSSFVLPLKNSIIVALEIEDGD